MVRHLVSAPRYCISEIGTGRKKTWSDARQVQWVQKYRTVLTTLLYWTVPDWTVLYWSCCTVLYYTVLNFTYRTVMCFDCCAALCIICTVLAVLYFVRLYCTQRYCTAVNCTELHCTVHILYRTCNSITIYVCTVQFNKRNCMENIQLRYGTTYPLHLKGHSHEIFCVSPIRDVLRLFRILTIFRGVIQILKRLPGVLYTGEMTKNMLPKKISRTKIYLFGWLLTVFNPFLKKCCFKGLKK